MIFAFPLKNPATKGFLVSTLTKLASNLSIYDDIGPLYTKLKRGKGVIFASTHIYMCLKLGHGWLNTKYMTFNFTVLTFYIDIYRRHIV